MPIPLVSTPRSVPPWFYRLPYALGGRRALVVDQHVVRGYLRAYDATRDAVPDDWAFAFTSDQVQVQIGRAVLDAALEDSALDAERLAAIGGMLGELQRRGIPRLSTITELPPPLLRAHTAFVVLLRATRSAVDALVLADAVVRRVPLLTSGGEDSAGIVRAVRSSPVLRYLAAQGLWSAPAEILIG